MSSDAISVRKGGKFSPSQSANLSIAISVTSSPLKYTFIQMRWFKPMILQKTSWVRHSTLSPWNPRDRRTIAQPGEIDITVLIDRF
jgi:hypothetical protein